MRSVAVSASVLLALLVLAAGPAAQAGAQKVPPPSPSQRYQTAVAGFPAPSPKGEFTAKGSLYFNGVKSASLTLSAKAATDGSTSIWHVEDRMSLAPGVAIVGDADLTQTLDVIRGTDKDTTGSKPITRTWQRKGSSIHLSVEGEGKAAKTQDISCSSKALTTWAGDVLLCRLIGASTGKYAFTMFVTDPADGKHVVPMNLSVRGAGKWKGKDALLYEESNKEGTAKLALDPKTLALLGLEIDLQGKPKVEFVPKGAEPAPKKAPATPDDFYRPPAKTPLQAACIMAFAAGTKNGDLFVQLFDWSAMYRKYRAAQPKGPLTEQQLREAIRRRVSNQSGALSPARMKEAIQQLKGDIQVQMDGNDRATVTLPKSLGGDTIEVEKLNGSWRLIGIT